MYMSGLVIAVLSITLSGVAASAEPPDWIGKEGAQLKAHRLDGNGSWTPTGKKRRSLQRWSLSVDRDDTGELRGSIVINDSPLLEAGLVRGSIRGRHLSGTITDGGGKEIAEFRGIVSADGVRGTYTDRTGETGDWVWDGPLPE